MYMYSYMANMKTMAKTLKCSQIQSLIQNFPGGHAPRPPSIKHAMHADCALHNNEHSRLITQLCVIICFWSASPIVNCFPQP